MKTILKNKLSLAAAVGLVSIGGAFDANAASFSLSGDYRIGSTMLVNPDLATGTRSGFSNSTNFLEHRFLLRPDVVIDERFSIKSELSFLQLAGDANSVGNHFGSSLDSSLSTSAGTQAFRVNTAYLRWASDWGLFRFGRIPKSWGLGLLYDGEADALDDFQTVQDRVDFQAMLGNLGVRLAFEKGAEGVLANDGDDIDTYELALDYANSDDTSAVGILYSRNVRSLKTTDAGGSSHDLSLFAKKRWNNFQVGGEFVSIATEDADAKTGALAQFDYGFGNWRVAYDFAFASSSSGDNFTFHPNYKPFMILFRHSVGTGVPENEIRAGRGVGSDVTGTGATGALLNKAHLSYNFASSGITVGGDFGTALARTASSAGSKSLGFEADLFVNQQWYDNFKVLYMGGLFFPGKAFGGSPSTAWGLEIKGVLEF